MSYSFRCSVQSGIDNNQTKLMNHLFAVIPTRLNDSLRNTVDVELNRSGRMWSVKSIQRSNMQYDKLIFMYNVSSMTGDIVRVVVALIQNDIIWQCR